jgi:hypothetical protein
MLPDTDWIDLEWIHQSNHGLDDMEMDWVQGTPVYALGYNWDLYLRINLRHGESFCLLAVNFTRMIAGYALFPPYQQKECTSSMAEQPA